MDATATAGRPRIVGDREQEIFRVTLDAIAEFGYDRLTLDSVAARARASKATLYRRWASKAALVADALMSLDGDEPPLPDTGSLREDLLAIAAATHGGPLDPTRTGLFCGLSTAMGRDPELHRALRTRCVDPRRGAIQRVLERARDRGVIRDDVDLALVSSVIPAVFLFRITVGEIDHPLDAVVRTIVDQLVMPAVRKGAG